MELRAAATSLHSSQPRVSSSTQALASTISFRGDGPQSAKTSGGRKLSQLHRSRSCDKSNSRVRIIARAAFSASFDPFSDNEFARRIKDDADFSVTRKRAKFQKRSVANSADIPLIRQQQQWREGIMQAGETAYCSVKKAFSSTVFIILELHSFALQMRGVVFDEDLQGLLENVQNDIHASFVWLFQKVFSQTPTLMVYVMILLANYSVYSMSTTTAVVPAQAYTAIGQVSAQKDQKNTSISINGTNGEESVSLSLSEGEEKLWISVVDEASKMAAACGDEALDQEAMRQFVSPVVVARTESDHYHSVHFRTELQYQMELAKEPNSSLLLVNFAQFLYLVVQDFERAEECFKRATESEPGDAEAWSKYGHFLWVVRKDLWAAEEMFLRAIEAEPNSPFYPADYAHFLWSTGGEDTCFPAT